MSVSFTHTHRLPLVDEGDELHAKVSARQRVQRDRRQMLPESVQRTQLRLAESAGQFGRLGHVAVRQQILWVDHAASTLPFLYRLLSSCLALSLQPAPRAATAATWSAAASRSAKRIAAPSDPSACALRAGYFIYPCSSLYGKRYGYPLTLIKPTHSAYCVLCFNLQGGLYVSIQLQGIF